MTQPFKFADPPGRGGPAPPHAALLPQRRHRCSPLPSSHALMLLLLICCPYTCQLHRQFFNCLFSPPKPLARSQHGQRRFPSRRAQGSLSDGKRARLTESKARSLTSVKIAPPAPTAPPPALPTPRLLWFCCFRRSRAQRALSPWALDPPSPTPCPRGWIWPTPMWCSQAAPAALGWRPQRRVLWMAVGGHAYGCT